jgi:hypothetical protein
MKRNIPAFVRDFLVFVLVILLLVVTITIKNNNFGQPGSAESVPTGTAAPQLNPQSSIDIPNLSGSILGSPDIPTPAIVGTPTLIVDLAGDMPDYNKFVVIVKLANGSVEEFIIPPSFQADNIRSNLKLNDGDVIVYTYSLVPLDTGPVKDFPVGTLVTQAPTPTPMVITIDTATPSPTSVSVMGGTGYPPPAAPTTLPYP